jgi:hypothetical protein
MSRPTFLVDQDFNEHIVEGLLRREATIDLIHCRTVGLDRRSDAEVLEFASQAGRIVLSHDVNTMTAAAAHRRNAGRPMSGLFLVPQTSSVRVMIEDLLLIWAATEAEEWQGQVQFLPL